MCDSHPKSVTRELTPNQGTIIQKVSPRKPKAEPRSRGFNPKTLRTPPGARGAGRGDVRHAADAFHVFDPARRGSQLRDAAGRAALGAALRVHGAHSGGRRRLEPRRRSRQNHAAALLGASDPRSRPCLRLRIQFCEKYELPVE